MLGAIAQLWFSTERRRFSVASLNLWVRAPVRLGQIAVTLDANGRWEGYVTWAYLTAASAQQMVHMDPPFLHDSDWNEGDQLWIIDVFAQPGAVRRVVRHARSTLSARFNVAHRVLRDGTGRIVGQRSLRLRTGEAIPDEAV